MIKTKYFEELPIELKEKINNGGLHSLYEFEARPFEVTNNRNEVFEILNYNLVLKELISKAKQAKDIEVLLILQGSEYFPKLYAYVHEFSLLMSKAKGESINKLRGIIEKEEIPLIIEQYTEACNIIGSMGYFDVDFKLEHIYWDRENQQLTLIDFGHYYKEQPIYNDGVHSNVNQLKKYLI